jgi:hypothetical protein
MAEGLSQCYLFDTADQILQFLPGAPVEGVDVDALDQPFFGHVFVLAFRENDAV